MEGSRGMERGEQALSVDREKGGQGRMQACCWLNQAQHGCRKDTQCHEETERLATPTLG